LLFLVGSAHAVVFSGEVRVAGTEPIFTPPSNSSPVVLRYFAADGSKVKAGDVVLRIDASPAENDLRKLRSDMAQAGAKNAKEIAELELKQADAELALADAQAERDTAAVDAAIPRTLISALDFDRHQSEMERTEKALALKKEQVDQAASAVKRRREDGELADRKQQLLLTQNEIQVAAAAFKAPRDGIVVHDFDQIFGAGKRYEEGSSSYPGIQVGQIVSRNSGFTVRAWVLEPDRGTLKVGQPVQLTIDAMPGQVIAGSIKRITDASEKKPEWGSGRYFAMDIDLPAGLALPLKSGMSVRVDSDVSPVAVKPAAASPATEKTLQADGEIFAQRSVAVLPPSVEGQWQMTITQMAPDGEMVQQGDTLVAFDAAAVMKDLNARQSSLAEKQRKQEQLRLDLADRQREAELATAQAQADMEKAERKANQPKEYIAGVEYKKLVIARTKAQKKAELSRQREQVAARARAAEQGMADADVQQLTTEVGQLQKSLGQLSVKAPRAGMFLHKGSWSGDKIDVGTQIWLGQSVGEMPDIATLAVLATLPERDMRKVRQDQHVEVVIAGGGDRRIGGSVVSIGDTVHSKSRVEAIPVVDLVVRLDSNNLKLKPGQSVRVEFPLDAKEAP
jgi:multidrug resistance efflux pump